MRKFIFFICLFIIGISSTNAKVVFNECVDGDTVSFNIDGKVHLVRFLAIDTPETKHPIKGEQPYGKEASKYTCDALKKANSITLEYDNNSSKTDKYGRLLAWIFIDGKLLQEDLVKNGLAEVAYLYGDYKYTSRLQRLQKNAQKNKLGIWSGKKSTDKSDLYTTIGIVIFIVVLCIFSKKIRKKVINKGKRKVNRRIDKEIDRIFDKF